jgi:hypothetical protein
MRSTSRLRAWPLTKGKWSSRKGNPYAMFYQPFTNGMSAREAACLGCALSFRVRLPI